MTEEPPIDRVDPDDVAVEGPESSSEGLFPVVGTDRTPSSSQIAQGRVGNGAWDLTDHSVEAARVEIHQQIKEEKDQRRHFFNENAKDGLLDAIKLHHRLIKRGLEVMDRLENPVEDAPVTAKDMTVLSMAQKSSKELADRGIGKAKGATEDQETTSFLTMLISPKE